jgi:hypothetical protein
MLCAVLFRLAGLAECIDLQHEYFSKNFSMCSNTKYHQFLYLVSSHLPFAVVFVAGLAVWCLKSLNIALEEITFHTNKLILIILQPHASSP